MNTVVEHKNHVSILIDDGKKIVENNEFLNDLSILMENKEFINFYNKHMTNWMDIKCTTIYMRLYSEFKNKYKMVADTDLDRHIVVFLLRKLMTDKELRPFSIKTIEKMQEKNWDTKKFWREFEKYMLVNKKQLLITDK